MTPQLATLVCLVLIGYLFWVDRKAIDGVSRSVWIPFLWMFFSGSRYASQWLDLGSPEAMSAQEFNEGSPLDRVVFLVLFLAGVWVLIRRDLDWRAILARNAWIWLFFLFAALSSIWSDEPVISLKRWIKGIGNLSAALILLTECRPYEALGFVMRRLGFVLIPLSVLFTRYYPDLGRTYHMGQPMYSGVAFSKNSLGQLCLIIGMYLCWELALKRGRFGTTGPRTHSAVFLILLPSIAWLLYVADSATSSSLMALAICLLLAMRLPSFTRKPRRVVLFGIATIGIVAALEYWFGIRDFIIRTLGREPDLTTRTPIWEILLEMAPNQWIGAGYESFWSGARLTEVWARLGDESGGIIQAHNGYIETYLNLGVIGLALLLLGIFFGLLNVIRQLDVNYSNAALRMTIIIAAVFYNYTEAAYKPLNNMFVLLLFAIMEVPSRTSIGNAIDQRRQIESGTRIGSSPNVSTRSGRVEW